MVQQSVVLVAVVMVKHCLAHRLLVLMELRIKDLRVVTELTYILPVVVELVLLVEMLLLELVAMVVMELHHQ
jgi:hypothetical protein